jgi:phosphatidylglycerophosphate synthase
LTAARNPPWARSGRPALLRDTAQELLQLALLLAALAAAVAWAAGLGMGYLAKVALLFGCAAALLWRGLRMGSHPHPRFGPANRITALRMGLGVLMAALLGESGPAAWPDAGAAHAMLAPQTLAWALVWLATVTALLDLADGALARRSGLASAFGARFDMETDAATILVLAALVWQAGQAGPWVLAAGLMRYAFVAAAGLWPWLAAPLAPSRRRQTLCVVQITSLIICLGPVVPAAWAAVLAATSLGLLAWSFAVDIQALARARRARLEP